MVGNAMTRFAGVLGLIFALGAATIGCSKKTLGDGDVGSVVVALTLPGGGIVNSVNYSITGNGITPIMGTIDVSAPGTTQATALVSGLLPATYTVTMSAASSDTQTCAGSAPFTVVAGQTALVDVILQCSRFTHSGSVAIYGRIDQCPLINSISATRLQAAVGDTIMVGVVASDLDQVDVVSYSWTASGAIGTFGSASTATTTFRCNATGTTALSIAITDGVCGDSLTNAIPITCTPAVGSGMGGNGGGGGGGIVGECRENFSAQALTPECTICQIPVTNGCCTLAGTDSTGLALCQAASACMATGLGPSGLCNNAGDVTSCYCGSNLATCSQAGQANGPCVAPMTAAAGHNVLTQATDSPSPAQVLARLTDSSYALGRARNLQQYVGANCRAQCLLSNGSCLETDPPAAFVATCMNCLATYENPTTDGCCGIQTMDTMGFSLCQAASACMRNGGPPVGQCNMGGDVTSCYCGTNAATCDQAGQANGPCVAQMTAAAARNVFTLTTDSPSPAQVLARQGDPAYALGRAANIQGDAGLFCPDECAIGTSNTGVGGSGGGTAGSGGAAGAGGAGGRGGAAGTGGSAGAGGIGGGGNGGGGGIGGFTCVETNPPPAILIACMTCIENNIIPATDGCCGVTDVVGSVACQSASACMRSGLVSGGPCNQGGDVTSCYCGTNPATCDQAGQPNGPCVAEMTAAAARNVVTMMTDSPNPSQVISRLGVSDYALGRAANVQGIAGLFCPSECGF